MEVPILRFALFGIEVRSMKHGQTVFLANLVRYLTHPQMLGNFVLKLLDVHKTDAVNAVVVVKVVSVNMTCHQHFEAISPHLLCRFDADAVTFLRRDLTFLEALISVIGEHTSRFVELPLGRHHSLMHCFGQTVDAGDV